MNYIACKYELFVIVNSRQGGNIMKWELSNDKYMTVDEVKALRKSTEDKCLADLAKGRTTWPRIWMLIDLATCTGLRVAEIAGLRVSDIVFKKDPSLHVIGKGNKPREVGINSKLVKHMKAYIKAEGLSASDHLLTSSHGSGYSTRGLQKHFKRACVVAALPDHYSIHSTRHTYGTLLYQSTNNLREVQKQLGHSKVTTTAIYADVTKEDIQRDVNKVFNGL
jgi:site-specific recombinase XerD